MENAFLTHVGLLLALLVGEGLGQKHYDLNWGTLGYTSMLGLEAEVIRLSLCGCLQNYPQGPSVYTF